MCNHKQSKVVSRSRLRARGSSAEMPLALFVALVFVVIPLIDLVGVVLAACSCELIALQCATIASTQPTFNAAMNAVEQQSIQLQSLPIMRFLNLVPAGGYSNCGVDLYVKADSYRPGQDQLYGPNTPVPSPIDPMQYVYEYCARSQFLVSPWVNLSGIPFLSQVPGLGRAVPLNFEMCRSVEIPISVEANANTVQSGFSPPPQISNVPVPLLPQAGQGQWNYPNIYQLIAASGQTVVSTDVFVVPANNPNLTISSVSIDNADNLWFDFRSDGVWNSWNGQPCLNADGYDQVVPGVTSTCFGANGQQLNGASLCGHLSNMSYYFEIGQQLTIPAPGTGALGAMMNDKIGAYDDNIGEMIVRVVVTTQTHP